MSPMDAFDHDAESVAVPEPPTTGSPKVVDKDALQAQFSGYEVVDHAQVRLTPVVLRDAPGAPAQALTRNRAGSRSYGRS